jgi:hypothetical protein
MKTGIENSARSLAAGADTFFLKAGNLASRLLSAIQEFFRVDREQNDPEPKHLYETLTTVE